ncbi:MAG TPA: class I SAM-dependent methyltransferase [Acidobacteriota bacterium]|nr:class I SAM-dependent methyltransferase [Acidobacteriota bacterium]
MPNVELEPGSFRDRSGRVVYVDDAVYRLLSRQALEEWQLLASSAFFRRCLEEGQIVATREADWDELPPDLNFSSQDWPGLLKHQRIPFISYPYEWPFEMLKDAALLHLRLLREAMAEGMLMKDSSPFNVQWRGTNPLFIDILSFQPMEEGEPWSGYRQFCQLFLNPLLLEAYKNVDFRPWLRGSIEGITPGECNALMSLRDRFRRGVFSHVYLQSKLESRFGNTPQSVKGQIKQAGFSQAMIERNVRNLEKLIGRLRKKGGSSAWSDYASHHSYTDQDHRAKADFVRRAADSLSPRLVWDLGCNVGQFSRIASEAAEYVVAIDGDPLTVHRLYQQLKREDNSKILPLVMNLADPSPALGWRGRERKNLSARGTPDLTLCLALLHHMVIGANVPLAEFIDWLASLGSSLVIEFVSKEDPMVEALLRNKPDQYDDYDEAVLEKCLQDHFQVRERTELSSGTRVLYLAERVERRSA